MAAQGGVELRGVVEEEEEEGPAVEGEIEPVKDADNADQGFDWNRSCAYKTMKIVRVRDRYLGMLYWAIVVGVILYIVIVAVGLDGKHQRQEPGLGSTIVKFRGKAFNARKEAFDQADLRYPEIEPGGAFIVTRSVTMKEQSPGACVDYDKPCKAGDDDPNVCTDCDAASKHCNSPRSWCPSIGAGNVAKLTDDGSTIMVEEMVSGMEEGVVEFFAGISFPGMAKKFYVAGQTEEDPQGVHELRNVTLANLLQNAETTYADVKQTGAVLAVAFYWNCDVRGRDCTSDITARRVDNAVGYYQKKATYYKKNGQDVRDATVMYGIRILVESSGCRERNFGASAKKQKPGYGFGGPWRAGSQHTQMTQETSCVDAAHPHATIDRKNDREAPGLVITSTLSTRGTLQGNFMVRRTRPRLK
ncbi:unnamed protein product [Amoebophrya sp. A120]|nr:unnamed protein product [Amoebophrya sp. A120]|eukprot:GSA120T00015410001.1